MDKYFWIVGFVIVFYGAIFMSRRKFFIDRRYEFTIFILVLYMVPVMMSLSINIYIFLLFILIVSFFRFKGRYTVSNINGEMFEQVLLSILNEKNISYEKQKGAVALTGYGDKRITYKQSMNSIDANFRDIYELDFYKTLKEEIKSRIKLIEERLFPSTGLFYIVIGIVFMVFILYTRDQYVCMWRF